MTARETARAGLAAAFGWSEAEVDDHLAEMAGLDPNHEQTPGVWTEVLVSVMGDTETPDQEAALDWAIGRIRLESMLAEAAALAWTLDLDQTAQRLELEPEFIDEQIGDRE